MPSSRPGSPSSNRSAPGPFPRTLASSLPLPAHSCRSSGAHTGSRLCAWRTGRLVWKVLGLPLSAGPFHLPHVRLLVKPLGPPQEARPPHLHGPGVLCTPPSEPRPAGPAEGTPLPTRGVSQRSAEAQQGGGREACVLHYLRLCGLSGFQEGRACTLRRCVLCRTCHFLRGVPPDPPI